MLEKIDEPIDVLCAYVNNRVIPVYFRWHNRRYKVDKVNLVHSMRRGRDKMYFFSVSGDNNYYRLCHDTEKNKWVLTEANLE